MSDQGESHMLSIRGLNQFYGGSHILWDIDLDIPRGSVTCLMGRNGMGKTTLLKCVMGLLPAATGEIRLGEDDLRKRPAEARATLGVGYVPQGREIFPRLTVEENLKLSLLAGRAKPGALDRIYETFPVLRQMTKRRGGDLSGGQQQQLAIGRALLLDPQLLILDEPCEGIQPNIVHDIGELILRLNREQGLTVLLVEQKLPFARRVASEFRILDKGRLVASSAIAGLTDDIVRKHLTV
ncbi:amino acid/amide ABC transporter ATP-binding protein 2 (HAAT family) [Sinimarinibacterium flocculans]|uniref:Amino acid/amide ABC transporter ATP-binding protein 2 (HAAT family) n=2 Tax=Sinimarinibacterium flocculans TaxID=985250 RepID=A0A318EIH5_9GAMM|nr:amino acid/amide ABC transporter ATP-binding protein 2 (HAAT family) [Sinimarinibacterium flocculans]